MHLYLVRHAEAKSEALDPSQGLSEKGLTDIRKVSTYAGKLGITVSGIFHSSKKRAMQTAGVLTFHLKPEKGLSESDGLQPMDNPGVWAGRLTGINDDIMLVGHLPHLSRLSSSFLCKGTDKEIISLETAGIVCLKRDGSEWSLKWALTPAIII